MPSAIHQSAARISVNILIILRPKASRNERYVILLEQPQVSSRSGRGVLELPAAMRDHRLGDVSGKTVDKLYEELPMVRLDACKDKLVDLTAMALEQSQVKGLKIPVHLNEHSPFLLWEQDLDRKEIEDIKGRLTDQRAHSNSSTIRVYDYEMLWSEATRNPTLMAAWTIYERLMQTGETYARLDDIRTGKPRR